MRDRLVDALGRKAPRRAFDRAAQRSVEDALGVALLQGEERARDDEQHEGRLLAFGAQAFDHAHVTSEITGEQRVRGVVGVVARDARHRFLHRLERELALRREQRELLHLLVRGKQIAFDALGEEGERRLVAALALQM